MKAELDKYAVENGVAATLIKKMKWAWQHILDRNRESLFAKSSFFLYSRKFNPSKISGYNIPLSNKRSTSDTK